MKRIVVLAMLGIMILSSCGHIRQTRAAKNQPYKPHQAKKMKQKKQRN